MGAAIYGSGEVYRERRTQRRTPTVLVVDDESSVLYMVSDVLEDEQIRVLTARSGQDALRIATRECPNLIITDLMMPGMNGRVLRERLRAQPRTAGIPVLLMTAAYKAQAPEGFAGIIPKPFDIDELLTQVSHHLSTG
jgi:CheY-like chemotaxis protein